MLNCRIHTYIQYIRVIHKVIPSPGLCVAHPLGPLFICLCMISCHCSLIFFWYYFYLFIYLLLLLLFIKCQFLFFFSFFFLGNRILESLVQWFAPLKVKKNTRPKRAWKFVSGSKYKRVLLFTPFRVIQHLWWSHGKK
jgi:hypothetical protein